MGKHCRCCTDKQRICSTCTVVGKKIPGPERPGNTLNKPRVKKLMVGVSKCSVEGRINEAGVQLQITGYPHLRSNQRPAHQFLHLVCLLSNILLQFQIKRKPLFVTRWCRHPLLFFHQRAQSLLQHKGLTAM